MPEIKFTNVVTFSSEDPVFKAENLLSSTSKVKKWRSLTEGEPQLSVVLQMEKPVQIQTIDIGNDGSAFVEVQVGRKGALNQDDFHVLLGAASFLTPLESRNAQNLNRVRMFNADKLNAEVAKQNWDQIKVVCTQPFNKHMKYGLSFIKVHSADSSANNGGPSPIKKLGAFTLRDEDDDTLMAPASVGGLFASRFKPQETKKGDSPSSGLSVAASIRSEATLASMVLSQEESSRKRKIPNTDGSSGSQDSTGGNSFYQLKKPPNDVKRRKLNVDDSPLPRRDVMPGEKVRTPKTDTKRSEEKDSKNRKDEKNSNKKIKIVDKPRRSPSPIAVVKPKPPVRVLAHSNKPFNRLMEGVFFAISGYQNPLRGQIRELGLEMGARYRPDWDSSCTHLVCAFPNTPKFRDVKSLGGKIVKKDWFEVCHRDRKRYPWRRFCLDNADKGQESEEEVWADDLTPSTSSTPATNTNDKDENLDTDEEIEKLQKESKKTPTKKTKNEEYDMDTDEEVEKLQKESKNVKNDYFDMDTDEEVEKLQIESKKSLEKKVKNDEYDHKIEELEKKSKISPEKKVKTEEYDMETDEEVESIKRDSNQSPLKPRVDRSKKTPVKIEYEMDTDEEEDKRESDQTNTNPDDIDSDVAYNADTDVDEENLEGSSSSKGGKNRIQGTTENRKDNVAEKGKDKKSIVSPTKSLSSSNGGGTTYFKGKVFLFYGPFDLEKRKSLVGSVRQAGGTIIYFLNSNRPDYIVTCEKWDRNFDLARRRSENVKFVRPKFIDECASAQSLLDTNKFEVK